MERDAYHAELSFGDNQKPGRMEWQQGAYKLNRLDCTPAEVASLVTTHADWHRVPAAILKLLALRTLKDSVRGECADWLDGRLRQAELFT